MNNQAKEIYKLNERLFFRDFSRQLALEKQQSIALVKLQELKDQNVKRQADFVKLRGRIQNLKSDIHIMQTSHKLKL